MVKNLIKKKSSMVAIALALTLAIATSLWFSVPAKAIFVTSTIPSSMAAGSTYSFDVQIDIEAGEATNIDVIRVIIRDLSGTPVRLVFFTPDGNILYEQPSGFIVSVTRLLPGYSGTSNLYAYGFGYTAASGFGYYTYDPGTGAGYGYGEGSANTTQLKYRITISTAGITAGSYQAIVAVEVSSTISFTSQFYPLTITAAPAAPAAKPGVTNVSAYVNTQGVFTQSVTAKSANNKVSVKINQGTKGLTKEGRRITEISITPMAAADVPAPPAGGNVIGLTYNFGPSGATFDEPITISFEYDPDDLPEGVSEEDLVIAVWDEDASEWVELPSVVDTENHIVTATVDHFTIFGIVVLPVEEEEEVTAVGEEEEEEPVGEEEEEVTPVGEEEEEEVPALEEEGIAWWVWLIVGLASATVVGLLVYFLWWRQRLA